jgi:hypothetical protein
MRFSAWTHTHTHLDMAICVHAYSHGCVCSPRKVKMPEYSVLLISLHSSVNIVTGLWAGRQGFDSRKGQGILSLRHRVQTGSGAHPAFVQWERGGHEADHSPPSSARLRLRGTVTSLHQYVFMAWYLGWLYFTLTPIRTRHVVAKRSC